MTVAIRLVAADIDGTITVRRGSLLLSQEAMIAIRLLEEAGIRVSLISGNSLPVTAGLARYVGAKGPSAGENGCVIFHNGQVIHVCKGKPPNDLVEKLVELGFKESWQNPYRHHDMAFYPPLNKDAREEGIRLAREMGYNVFDSGFAIHILPRDGGKGEGLRKIMELLKIDKNQVIAIGDGENDMPLLKAAGYSACPADADEFVKLHVNYVAKSEGGKGFAEIAKLILNGELP